MLLKQKYISFVVIVSVFLSSILFAMTDSLYLSVTIQNEVSFTMTENLLSVEGTNRTNYHVSESMTLDISQDPLIARQDPSDEMLYIFDI